MRRILLIAVALSCLIATSGCSGISLGPLDDFLNEDRLDEATVAAGLRDALTTGTTRAARTLSKPGAFADDARFRIELPEKLDPVRKALDLVGYARVMDDFEVAMNDAAGLAAGEAVSVFGDVISSMSIQDAWDILRGPDDAATRYLEAHASPRLRRRFAPVIAQAMRESGVYSLYADIQSRYAAIPFTKPDFPDLDAYLTDRTLAALFSKLSEEEALIREDPAARTTALLRKVFGSPEAGRGETSRSTDVDAP